MTPSLPFCDCWHHCLTQVSRKTTVETVTFHKETSAATYLTTSVRGAAHVFYLSKEALSSFWRDSPSTWDTPKFNIASVSVAIGGSSVKHKGTMRTCHPPLVCSRMRPALSGLVHTEVNFEHPDWVAAMDSTVTEGTPEYVV